MNQLFVNDLTVIDFSFFDPARGIVGESWLVDIVLGGELDEQGMVFDFGHVKKQIKQIIDHELDHRLVLAQKSLDIAIAKDHESLSLSWSTRDGEFVHRSPFDAVVLLDSDQVNKVSVAHYLEYKIKEALPSNVRSVELTLREEQIEGAYYHYSHGLKKHLGNCQRIVHGHRSKIEIFENHKRNTLLEDLWAAKLRNIYIATTEDLRDEFHSNNAPHYTFSYAASQGEFELSLPAKFVYLIETDSTVELIAEHIAEECNRMHPENHYLIRAYEGVGKGSIAERNASPEN